MRRRALIILLALLVPTTGHGHGREPEVVEVQFDLDDPLHIVASSSFGLVRTRDGGQRWDWQCRTLFDGDELDNPALALPRGDAGPALLVGAFSGLHRTVDGGCGWAHPEPELVDTIVNDLHLVPGTRDQLVALRTRGTSQPDALWRSSDAGASWARAGEVEARLLLNAVQVAPSQPERLWASAVRPGTVDAPALTAIVLQSDDGGTTWVEHPVEMLEHEIGIEIFAIDPVRPHRVYLGTRSPAGLAQPPERLLVAELDEITGTLATTELLTQTRIAAVATDGATVWTGGEQLTGLWRATGEPLVFEQLQDGFDVRCLALSPHDGALWMCGKPRRETFGLARSYDGGLTIEPMFTRDQIERREPCGNDSQAAMTCALEWFDLVADLDLDESLLTPPGDDVEPGDDVADAGDVTEATDTMDVVDTAEDSPDTTHDTTTAPDTDTTLDMPTGGDGEDCGCRVSRPGPSHHSPWVLGLTLLTLLATRRRRATHRARTR